MGLQKEVDEMIGDEEEEPISTYNQKTAKMTA
jgi:hypothetical protein